MARPTTFAGIPAEGLAFLTETATRQDRDWFREHKADFERLVREPVMGLAAAVTDELDRRDVALMADPKRSITRIYRDIRFSKDKTPFRDFLGIVFSRHGTKDQRGEAYVQIGATRSFLAAGFWCPTPSLLKGLRSAIVARPEAFASVVAELAEEKLTLLPEYRLTRLPRDFPDVEDETVADWVRCKSFVVERPLSEAVVTGPRLVKAVADFAEQAVPLLAFGWPVADALPPE